MLFIIFGQLNPPSAPKPNEVVRQSQSFHSTALRKKDFRLSRAATSPFRNSQPLIGYNENSDEIWVWWWNIIHLVIIEG